MGCSPTVFHRIFTGEPCGFLDATLYTSSKNTAPSQLLPVENWLQWLTSRMSGIVVSSPSPPRAHTTQHPFPLKDSPPRNTPTTSRCSRPGRRLAATLHASQGVQQIPHRRSASAVFLARAHRISKRNLRTGMVHAFNDVIYFKKCPLS